MRRTWICFGLLIFSASTASAVEAAPLPFAQSSGSYWHGFWKFWGDAIGSQSGMVLFALGLGAVSLFIITRGKWRK